ncbi:MAG: hypothetical protein O2992_05400 [Gemmatimonadetes bacterium]|nr:hypothetical protein [Gemmatimonadota bacterium]
MITTLNQVADISIPVSKTMRPFTLGTTTFIQGLYTVMWMIVLGDVASPTFNIEGFADASWLQAVVWAVVIITASVALGVVMHTLSRSVFHMRKLQWGFDILSSDTVSARLSELEAAKSFPGGLNYADVLNYETPDRVVKAGAILHQMGFQVMAQAPDVYDRFEVCRDQYRLARAFILPSIALAFTLPLWAPVAALDGAGAIGPFPIIRGQLFLLGILAASVSYMAFRERSYRYYAAKILAFVTIEGMAEEH